MHSCEDIVQETFLRIWEKKQNLIGSGDLPFYLYAAIRNNCLTHLQKQQKTVLRDIEVQELTETPGEKPRSDNPEADYDTLLKNALDNLPPKCREVFMLSRISGLTYQQIGQTLDISVKTVENQMCKALKILRAFIKQKHVSILWLIIGIFSFLTGRI
jgi:RNA polymerase sigma-70 factor (ECF subfamily)